MPKTRTKHIADFTHNPNFKSEAVLSQKANRIDVGSIDELAGVQKAALFLITMGSETSSSVLRELNDQEVRDISLEIARMENIPSDTIEDILVEYNDMDETKNAIAKGGENTLKDMLVEAYGPDRAEEMLMQVQGDMEISAFHLLQTVETGQLTNFLQNEHPQTCALIISHLHPRKAADLVSELAPPRRDDILYRVATMKKTSPEILDDIQDVIRNQLGSVFGSDLSSTGGYDNVAEILSKTSRSTERELMEAMRERDEEVATEIKNLMFVFDDLEKIQGRDLQRILTEVDQRDLALALKLASQQLKDKIMDNVSERVAAAIEEELELMGKVRIQDVDEAQRRILDIAQELEQEDEIVLSTGEETLV